MDDQGSQFKWGKVLEEKFTTKVKLVEEECSTYESFEMDGVKVNVGDSVVIRKRLRSISRSSDLRNSYVAKVTVLYDTGACNDSCHRAVINWYCRKADLNQKLIKSMSEYPLPPIEVQEVFADRRNKCVDDIDAETIFQTCKVTKVDAFLKNLPQIESDSFHFILRWKYFGDFLEPVLRISATPLKSTSNLLVSDEVGEFHSDEEDAPSCFKVKNSDKYCTPTTNSRLTMTLVRTSKTSLRRKPKSARGCHSVDGQHFTEPVQRCSSKAKKKLILDAKQSSTPRSQFGRKITPNKKYADDSSEDDELNPVLPIPTFVTPTKLAGQHLSKDCFVKIERSPHLINGHKDNFSTPIKLLPRQNVGINTPSSTKQSYPRRKIFSSEDETSPVKRAKQTVPQTFIHSRSGRKIKMKLFDDGIKNEESDNSDPAYSDSSDDFVSDADDKPRQRAPRKVTDLLLKTPRSLRKADRTPSMPKRTTKLQPSKCGVELARGNLHSSAIPNSLPCREKEFAEIFTFIEGKIATKTGGCIYISGVPGTGKTATVNKVIGSLQKLSDNEELPSFKFLNINGMKLTEPRQAYVQIYTELCGQKVTPAHAVQLLNKHVDTSSNSNRESVVILVDELDLLWNRKQDVLYNLFNWPSKPKSSLVVIAIANTMDLPERIMKNRISSRLGLTRVTFQPYNFKQLQQILLSRLSLSDVFDPDSVQFIARKVAAFSGDARRALEICRRAAELVGSVSASPTKKPGCVGMAEADAALQEMFSSPKIEAIRNASLQERIFLRAVVCEFQRIGLEESTFNKIYDKHKLLCRVEGLHIPSSSEAMTICARLGSCRLLLLENGRNDILQRVRLNISTDDVTFALNRAIADQ
ncbi:Origin recognition complex, subunit 1 [Chamberlinius hualienensis]